MFVGYFVHIHTIDKVKCRVFILTQLNINQRQRLWALMDTHTRQPLLYPLIYLRLPLMNLQPFFIIWKIRIYMYQR
ncbi:phage integrase domain protein [Escherichia coli DEC13A]|nr:phage integrase domain protein [Escherichia coli DEC13A]EHX63697.1 phage integrase domain protein [Escherichia coli DEC13C]